MWGAQKAPRVVNVKVGPDYDYFEYVWRSPSGWYASSGHN
jgi:hypothetical protein